MLLYSSKSSLDVFFNSALPDEKSDLELIYTNPFSEFILSESFSSPLKMITEFAN